VGLLKKVHTALRPGGRAATLEFVPNEDRVSPPMPTAFSMTMLASTVAGDAYTLSELTDMYNQAGFGGVTAAHPMSPHTVVMGASGLPLRQRSGSSGLGVRGGVARLVPLLWLWRQRESIGTFRSILQ